MVHASKIVRVHLIFSLEFEGKIGEEDSELLVTSHTLKYGE